MSEKKLIYLDNAATTAVDPAVLEEMLPFYREEYANPAASSTFSAKIRNSVEKARERVASLIGADAGEIFFTSGGTESDNLAVFGTIHCSCGEGGLGRPERSGVITSMIEHPAVLNPCRELEKSNFRVCYAPCNECGVVDADYVKRHTDGGTALISIMTANNELGSIQDIDRFADIAHSVGAVFHTDAVQAAGHIPLDVKASKIDLLSISSHKLHGPKGVGALFVRKGTRLSPVLYGGGQERGLRSGTLNVPGIAGFGKACEIARLTLEETYLRMMERRKHFYMLLKENISGVRINGPDIYSEKCIAGDDIIPGTGTRRGTCPEVLPGILSVSFDGIEGSSLLIELDMKGICCSTGSACSASSDKPSHVLTAAGLAAERIKGSIRFSFSRFTSDEELEYTAKAVGECVERLRAVCG